MGVKTVRKRGRLGAPIKWIKNLDLSESWDTEDCPSWADPFNWWPCHHTLMPPRKGTRTNQSDAFGHTLFPSKGKLKELLCSINIPQKWARWDLGIIWISLNSFLVDTLCLRMISDMHCVWHRSPIYKAYKRGAFWSKGFCHGLMPPSPLPQCSGRHKVKDKRSEARKIKQFVHYQLRTKSELQPTSLWRRETGKLII